MSPETKHIKLKDLVADPVAVALVKSENMRPYLDLMMAQMKGENTDRILAVIRDLPFEKRYVSRVVQALEWGLADCDPDALQMDLAVLSHEKIAEIRKQLEVRLFQLQLLLKTVRGDQP